MRLILLLSIAIIGAFAAGAWPSVPSHNEWPSTRGTVEKIGEHYTMAPVTMIGGAAFQGRGSGKTDVTVSYSYVVNGASYADKYKIRMSLLYPQLFEYYLPKQCVVRYDPHDPQSSVLVDAIDLQYKITGGLAVIFIGAVLIGALIRSGFGASDA